MPLRFPRLISTPPFDSHSKLPARLHRALRKPAWVPRLAPLPPPKMIGSSAWAWLSLSTASSPIWRLSCTIASSLFQLDLSTGRNRASSHLKGTRAQPRPAVGPCTNLGVEEGHLRHHSDGRCGYPVLGPASILKGPWPSLSEGYGPFYGARGSRTASYRALSPNSCPSASGQM